MYELVIDLKKTPKLTSASSWDDALMHKCRFRAECWHVLQYTMTKLNEYHLLVPNSIKSTAICIALRVEECVHRKAAEWSWHIIGIRTHVYACLTPGFRWINISVYLSATTGVLWLGLEKGSFLSAAMETRAHIDIYLLWSRFLTHACANKS